MRKTGASAALRAQLEDYLKKLHFQQQTLALLNNENLIRLAVQHGFEG